MLKTAIDRRNKDAVMGLGEHLDELRKRIFLAVIGFVPVFIIAMFYGDVLLDVATLPLRRTLHAAHEPNILLVVNSLESFSAYVKLAAIVTLVIAGPWVIYQLWKFIAPGLYAHERRFIYILAPFSTFMSLAGIAFCYFVVLRVMFFFLITFSGSILKVDTPTVPLPPGATLGHVLLLPGDPPNPQPGDDWINTDIMQRRSCLSIDAKGVPEIGGVPLTRSGISQQYRLADAVDLFVMSCLATAIGFQTPVVVLLLGWIGLVNPKTLSKYRRHAIAVCAFLGAILTPSPDPGSMMVIAIPMYLLYELGLLLVIFLPARRVLGKPKEPAPPDDNNDGGGP